VYRKLITLPTGITWENTLFRILLDGASDYGEDKEEVQLDTDYLSSTTFYLLSPVNTQAFTIIYG